MKDENRSLKERLNDQRSLIKDLENRYGILEGDLAEAEAWKSRYEAGAGLEEAVKYQKKLKADLKRRDTDNLKLRDKLNDQIEACGRLNATCQRLKQELGKPEDFQYDDLAIEEHMKGEAAAANALIKQLEEQIDSLEEERTRLLNNLRNTAKQMGATGFKHLGLSPDQLILVNEFVANVKEGKADLRPAPLNPRTQALQEEIENLKVEVARAEARADTLYEQLTGQPSPQRESPVVTRVERPAEDNEVLESLKNELKSLSETQAKMIESQQTKGSDLHIHVENASPAETPKSHSVREKPQVSTPPVRTGVRAVHPSGGFEISAETIATATAAAVTDALTSAQRTMLPIFETVEEVNEAAEVNLKLECCLKDLAERDAKIVRLEQTIRKFEAALVSINDQHAVLYRDFVDREAKKESALQHLRSELTEMTEKCNEFKIRSARLDEVCSLLNSSGDEESVMLKYQFLSNHCTIVTQHGAS